MTDAGAGEDSSDEGEARLVVPPARTRVALYTLYACCSRGFEMGCAVWEHIYTITGFLRMIRDKARTEPCAVVVDHLHRPRWRQSW